MQTVSPQQTSNFAAKSMDVLVIDLAADFTQFWDGGAHVESSIKNVSCESCIKEVTNKA